MVNLRRKPREEFKIDVSALVDVLFTLLIFFSLTSTFVSERGISVDLPSASSSGSIIDQKKIYISVTDVGEVAIDDEIVSSDMLKNILSKIDLTERMKYLVVLKADMNVTHGKVTEILDILKQLKFEGIAIATREQK